MRIFFVVVVFLLKLREMIRELILKTVYLSSQFDVQSSKSSLYDNLTKF